MGRGNPSKPGRGSVAGNDGATLVEFALVLPLLVLLLCGIIEVGWLFTQNLDVRHGASEAVRLAAVDEPLALACTRIDVAAPEADIRFQRDGNEVGDEVRATVEAPARTLTGILDWAFPDTMRLEHTARMRLEQRQPSWSSGHIENC